MQNNVRLSRERIGLAIPILLLLAGGLVSWPWRVLQLPGTIGDLSPIALGLLMVTAYGGARSMARRLPMKMITWPPAGLAAVFFLMVGFGASALEPAAAPVVLVGYTAVFVFVVVVSMALAKHGTSYAVAFACLFLMSQAIQFPVFELDSPDASRWAPLLTTASATRAIVEMIVLIWLAQRLVLTAEVSPPRVALAMVGLVLVHGLLVAWEQPLRSGADLTGASYAGGVALWTLSTGLQLGIVTVMSRLFRGWGEQTSTAQERATDQDSDDVEREPPTARRLSGKPTPRRRRRR
jgi:hypothetical protein